jgi:large subunit ribosomal protein L20
LYTVAKSAVDKGRQYALRDRRQKKRDYRALWILRINAAAREHGISYSRFIAGLKRAGVELDRSVLADLAACDPKSFGELATLSKEHLATAKA